jgi:hypothetical protein
LLKTKSIEKFVYNLWYESRRNTDRESLSCDREFLLCDKLISDEIIDEKLRICTRRSKMMNMGEMFMLLKTSQHVHISKEVKKVNLVINETKKNGAVYTTPPNECETH